MVLASLGNNITGALKKFVDSNTITTEVLDEVVKDLSKALIVADVPIAIVQKFRDNIKQRVNLEELGAGADKRQVLQQAVFEQLVDMMTPKDPKDGSDIPPFRPKRNKTNVVMMVGLQGSGKTTTCAKIAYFYKRKGFRVALVGADTFRAGARDQLHQNAVSVGVPCFTSDVDDPAEVASEGVKTFREARYEIIIVDTSGRTQQDEQLMEEMGRVQDAAQPDHVMFILDGTNSGKIIADQSRRFHETVGVGSHVVTKLDSNDTKGGGALTSVVSTAAPISFIGVGERFQDTHEFNPTSFVSRMLGMGDIGGLFTRMQDAGLDTERNVEVVSHMLKGETTFADVQEQLKMVDTMLDGNGMGDLLGMLPGMGGLIPKGQEEEGMAKFRRMQFVFDSMTPGELKMAKLSDESRLRRLALGSGVRLEELRVMMSQLKKMSQLFSMMGKGLGKGGLNPGALGNLDPRDMQKMMSSMMGGLGGLGGKGGGAMAGQMKRVMDQMGGPAGMVRMMQQMGGKGGKGMPDMGQAMKMAQKMGMGGMFGGQ